MTQLVTLWSFVRRHKYLITLLVFAVIIVFLDENSILHRMEYAREIQRLKGEIEEYRAEYEEATRRLKELDADSSSIEHIARERYLMKKPNEDIFIFEEDLKE